MATAERILEAGAAGQAGEGGPVSEEALVRAAQAGSSEAASALIERYYPRILSFVSHLTHGRGNAEDLTQEVFARALAALGRFNGNYRFEHWLLRIAKNLCIDEARRNQHRAEPTDPTELPDPKGVPGADFVWESVSRDLATAIVHRALARLPPRQRTVLVLKEIEGLSYSDIGRIMGTSLRGVETSLRRARARFRLEVARVESDHRDVCRRILRRIADEPDRAPTTEAVAAHLRSCAECRIRSRAIAAADGAFALLLPAEVRGVRGLEALAGKLAERGREVVRALRDGARTLSSSALHLTEIAASAVVVAALSTGPSPALATGTASGAGLPHPVVAAQSASFGGSASQPGDAGVHASSRPVLVSLVSLDALGPVGDLVTGPLGRHGAEMMEEVEAVTGLPLEDTLEAAAIADEIPPPPLDSPPVR